jgi:hypothetical protein
MQSKFFLSSSVKDIVVVAVVVVVVVGISAVVGVATIVAIVENYIIFAAYITSLYSNISNRTERRGQKCVCTLIRSRSLSNSLQSYQCKSSYYIQLVCRTIRGFFTPSSSVKKQEL